MIRAFRSRRSTAGGVGTSQVNTRRGALRLSRYTYLLMLAPGLGMYLVFIIWPFVDSIRISFYDWSGLGPMTDFVGLGNYTNLFNRAPIDRQLNNALLNTIQVFALSTVLSTGVGLLFALILSRKVRGARAYQALYFMPNTLSVVVVGFLWNLLLNPQFGAVNAVLRGVGLDALTRPWLGDPNLALPSIIAVSAWANLGFPLLIFLAAILGIPSDLIEAARLDGASELRVIGSIVVPLLWPTMITMIALNFIASINSFELIFAMEGAEGGPFFATDVLGTLFYRMAFGGFGGTYAGLGLGAAAALATLMLLIVLPVSVLVILFQRRVSHEY
ncbi:MAG: sugar ABC transporter permease [Chloroflexota bacterium]|nr:sugar ABC transporter permease [Chloroflexota bacterium]